MALIDLIEPSGNYKVANANRRAAHVLQKIGVNALCIMNFFVPLHGFSTNTHYYI